MEKIENDCTFLTVVAEMLFIVVMVAFFYIAAIVFAPVPHDMPTVVADTAPHTMGAVDK